ncbi:MAG: EF-P 5-aminopentanol modification-associated protein YfmF [Bacillota bacterium]
MTVEVGPGIKYRYLPVNKWKTLSIDVFCLSPLRRETVTALALVPRLAKRGTGRLPTLRDLARHLEGMYGSTMSADATKIGPAQVLRFGMDVPSLEGQSLGKAMAFIWDVVTNPYLDGEAYPADRFDTEREEHRRDILSIINHRPRYATVRMIEELSKGDDSGLPAWGVLEDLPSVSPRATWEIWRDELSICPISIYAIGDGAEELAGILQRASLEFPGKRSDTAGKPVDVRTPPLPDKPVMAEDSLPGDQTILCAAFRTGVTERDPRMPAMILYDGILGGFPHSKLFVNVREKHSMAYFADSSLNSWRGLVTATAGILDVNREKVVGLIEEQVEAMKRGDIEDREMAFTKAGLIRRYRSESDSQSALVRRFLTSEIMGGPATEEELVSRIERVTKDDVVAVAQDVKLAAVYALRAKDDGASG